MTETFELKLDGMNCEGCVRGVRRALERSGVHIESVEIGRARFTSSREQAEALLPALKEAGFPALIQSSTPTP